MPATSRCLERLGRLHELAELGPVEARDAEIRDCPGAREERRAEHDRHLAEPLPRLVAHRDAALAVGIALHEANVPDSST